MLDKVDKIVSILAKLVPAYDGLNLLLNKFTFKRNDLYQIIFLEGSYGEMISIGTILFLIAIIYLVKLIKDGFDFGEDKTFNVLYILVTAICFMMLGVLAKPASSIELVMYSAVLGSCVWFFIVITRIKYALIFTCNYR